MSSSGNSAIWFAQVGKDYFLHCNRGVNNAEKGPCRLEEVKKGIKKALPSNRFDIPLSCVYCGKYILLLRLRFADPLKLRVCKGLLASSRVRTLLRGFGSSVLWMPVIQPRDWPLNLLSSYRPRHSIISGAWSPLLRVIICTPIDAGSATPYRLYESSKNILQ